MTDIQFNELMNRVSTIIYYSCLVIGVTATLLSVFAYRQYRKSKKELELFESEIRQRFLKKHGHHNYFKDLNELEKDAERVRELNSEEIIEPKKTKANHKAEELEIKTYNLAFSFIETILAKLNKDGVSRYADHIALKLGVADRVAEKLLDVNRYQTIYNFVKLADLAGLEIYITLKDKKTFEVFDYMKISTEIEEE